MAEERRVGVAVDFSPCSRKALSWALNNLIRKGDHLILLNIQPEAYYESGEMQLWETTGSRMSLSLIHHLYSYFCLSHNLCHSDCEG